MNSNVVYGSWDSILRQPGAACVMWHCDRQTDSSNIGYMLIRGTIEGFQVWVIYVGLDCRDTGQVAWLEFVIHDMVID